MFPAEPLCPVDPRSRVWQAVIGENRYVTTNGERMGLAGTAAFNPLRAVFPLWYPRGYWDNDHFIEEFALYLIPLIILRVLHVEFEILEHFQSLFFSLVLYHSFLNRWDWKCFRTKLLMIMIWVVRGPVLVWDFRCLKPCSNSHFILLSLSLVYNKLERWAWHEFPPTSP